MTKLSRVDRFCRRLGYKIEALQEARGHSGRIWILNIHGNYTISIIDIYQQAITVKMKGQEENGLAQPFTTVLYTLAMRIVD